MAMTVRLPQELDAQLDEIARARHISKHAVIIEAASRFVRAEAMTTRVLDAVDVVGTQYADALVRLGSR